MTSRPLRGAPIAQPDERSPLLRNAEAGGSEGTTLNGEDDRSDGHPIRSRNASTSKKARRDDDNERGSQADDSSDETPVLPASDTPYLNGITVRRFWAIFIILNLTFFIAVFDSTIMASSHPVITSYFHSSNSASWLSTSFLLTLSVIQPLIGRITDSTGRKVPFIVATAIITTGTLWCTLAQSMVSFILGRALSGFGAGAMYAVAGILISDLVPIERRGIYQSILNIVYGVGAASGAALGGVLADSLGWRWEFGVQVPVLAASIVMSLFALPGDLGLYGRERESLWTALKTFDIKGSVLLMISITFLILGMNLGGNVLPWSHPFIIVSIVVFAICFPIFLHIETKATKPVMPPHLVRKSPHGNLIFSNFIGCILQTSVFFNVPLFFQGVLLSSATNSGLRLALPSGFASIVGATTGILITYTRRLKWPLVLGTVLTVLGTAVIAGMRPGWPEWLYLLCLLPSSAGQGFQFPGTFMAILAASEQQAQAVTTSTLLMWRSLGFVMGVASSSLVVQNALVWYLRAFVDGPEKEAVIKKVRRSVEAIRDLSPEYQAQVVQSYEAALRLTFICLSVLAIISVLLVLPIRLPRLGIRK